MLRRCAGFVGILVALAAPSTASAEAIVTNTFGEPAAEVSAVSENTIWKWATGTWSCNTINLDIALTQNDTTVATGAGEGTATGSGTSHTGTCEIAELGARIIHSTELNLSHLQLNGDGTGTASFTYVYDVYSKVPPHECHFEGTVPVTYSSGTNVLSIAGAMEGKALNPASTCNQAGEVSGELEVLDEFGMPVVIH